MNDGNAKAALTTKYTKGTKLTNDKKTLILVTALTFLSSLAKAEEIPKTLTPPVQAQDSGGILREADYIFQDVSRLSGLPILRPVQKELEDRIFFRNYYLGLFNEQYPPEKRNAEQKAYVLLGFLPPEVDLVQAYLASFLPVVQGVYDPKSKTLYIADWIAPEDQEATLAHELCHALQDQAFDLGSFLERGKDDSMDEQFARMSVMEGQAAAIALNYSLQEKGQDFTQLANIADWTRLSNLLVESGAREFGKRTAFRDAINFPYVQGAAFLQGYVRTWGWKGMGALFQRPPDSTRQVIHPRDFFPRRKIPLKIEIEDLGQALSGAKKIWEDRLGEYGLSLFLRRSQSERESRAAVEGWSGDQVQVYEVPGSGRSVLVGYVVFDQETQADRFFDSCRALARSRTPEGKARRSDETIEWITQGAKEGDGYLEHQGRRVLFLEGATPGEVGRVRTAIWDIVQRKGPKAPLFTP